MQWGLGVIGPDLQHRYGLSAASLGALINATALGNAVALIAAGVLVDRSGPRRPLLVAGSACGLLLLAGASLTNPVGLGIALFASGVAGAVVAVAATVSVFHGFPPERRGFALGMRQMSVSLGGLLAAVLLPLSCTSAASASRSAARGAHGGQRRRLRARPPARPIVPPAPQRRVIAPLAVMREPGMPQLMLVGVLYICALVAVLTFSVPALRDGGASRGEGSLLFAFVSISAMVARVSWGRLADGAGGRRRVATLRDVGLWPAVPPADLGRVALGTAVQIAALIVLSLGALGFNGVLYVIAGEISGRGRAGQAVASCRRSCSAAAPWPRSRWARSPTPQGYRSLWLAAAAAAGLGALGPTGRHAAAPRDGCAPAPAWPAPMLPAVAAPVRVGQELELTVDSLAAGGRGVARHEGVVVFVDRALPGDRVMARIQRSSAGTARRSPYERLAVGPDRVEAPCPHFGTCGGCRWQDLLYERQLEHKQQQVLDALQRIAGLPDAYARADRAGRLAVRTTATSSSTPGRPRRAAPRSASTGRPLGGDRPARGLPADGLARQRDPRDVRRLGPRAGPAGLRPGRRTASCATSWCARACAPARRSASWSPVG